MRTSRRTQFFQDIKSLVASGNFLFLLLVTALAIAAGWFILEYIIKSRGVFGFDEAGHALKGALFAHDVRELDWLAFLFDSYRLVLYPPLHYWFSSLFFLLFGMSVISAVLASLVAYVLISPTLYLSGLQLHDDFGSVAGIVAAALFLTTPQLIMHSSFSMLELSGLLSLCIAILVYLRLIKTNARSKRYIFLSFGILLTFFTRVPYGIVLFIAVVITEIVGVRLRPSRQLARRLFFILVPMAIVLGLWFVYLPKLTATWNWLVNIPNVDSPFSLEALLYFPRQIISFPSSIWVTILLLAALIVSFRFVNDKRILFLLALVIVQFSLGELHQTKHARYMFPVLPPMFLLAGAVVAKTWHRFGDREDFGKFLLPRVLTVILLLHVGFDFIQTLRNPANSSNLSYKVAPYIGEKVEELGTAIVIGAFDIQHPTPVLMDWYLISEAEVMDPPQAGSAVQIEEERKLAALLTESPLPNWLVNRLAPIFSRSDQRGKTRSIQLGIPARTSYSQSAEGFREFFLETYDGEIYDGVVLVTSTREGSMYPPDYTIPSLYEVGLEMTSSKEFEDLRTRVDVFKSSGS